MEKRISYSQFQQVKACAKMIDPCTTKIESLKKKIMPLVEEMKGYQTQIDALEQGIVSVLGFHVSELVKKVIEPTGAVDKNGKPIKVTKYLPTDMVSYDEQKKQFVIHIPDEESTNVTEPIVPPTTTDVPGSDFDKDTEAAASETTPSESDDMLWNE
jgi:hypothetical protein